jgi:hypothetical protein
VASPGEPRKAADVDAPLPPPASETGAPPSPEPAARRTLDPGQREMARQAGAKGGRAPRKSRPEGSDDAAVLRRLSGIQGDLTNLRQEVHGLSQATEQQVSTMLDQRLAPVEALLRDILNRLDGALSASAGAGPQPNAEPQFADPSQVPPTDSAEDYYSQNAWTNQLFRQRDASPAELSRAVLAVRARDYGGNPTLTLRRSVARAGVYTFARYFTSAYPPGLTQQDGERLEDETVAAVPDATLLTEQEFVYALQQGLTERNS